MILLVGRQKGCNYWKMKAVHNTCSTDIGTIDLLCGQVLINIKQQLLPPHVLDCISKAAKMIKEDGTLDSFKVED
jgi:hypothetical protein